jgi:DHA1 family tetracycline resistance protein-like MFS transporter
LTKLASIDRRLLTILLIVFVQIAGASLILPILPLYAKYQFAMSPETITLMVSSFFMAQFLAGPLIGRLSDKYGRLPVLIISQIGTAISFVMIAYAHSVQMLFLARILDGITGGNIIVAQAYITDITPREKHTEALGFIIGPAFGGGLAAIFGAHTPFLIAAAAAITVIITWLALDETLSPAQRLSNRTSHHSGLAFSEILRNMPLMLVLFIGFTAQLIVGIIQATFALYGVAVLFKDYSNEMATFGVGLLLTTVGLGQFFTQTFLLRRMLKQYGELKLVIIGLMARSCGMFILAAITSPWIAIFAAICLALGSGLTFPPLQALATKTVHDELRGGVLGLYQSIASLATIVSTAMAGWLFSMNPTIPYWGGAILGLLTILPVLMLMRQPTPKIQPLSA